MEFNEKLQMLRKHKGLTQEELAAQLLVSRTAVSKWKSGRGYPNIDSLKAIAMFYGVTIDELLSGDELLLVAKEDQREKQAHICNLVFGLLDLGAVLLFFLPLCAQRAGGSVLAVSLLSLTSAAPYMKAAYCALAAGLVLSGALALAPHSIKKLPTQPMRRLSLLLHAACALLMIVSLQPYAAVFLFTLLVIKAFLLLKQP